MIAVARKTQNKTISFLVPASRHVRGVGQSTLLALGLVVSAGHNAQAQVERDFTRPLQTEKRAVHALNRLAFGPRPGDVERVNQLGVERWIDLQLSPQTVGDAALERKASGLKTLQLPARALMLAQLADTANLLKKSREMAQQQRQIAQGKEVKGEMVKLNSRQRAMLATIEELGMAQQTSVQAVGELQLDKTVRAIESQRQLYEVMVDFWSNHFNLDVKKNGVRALKVVDEREVIRPHVFSKFRQLLGASAKSPAMLIYLDNASSTREMEMAPRRANRQPNRVRQVTTAAPAPATAAPATATPAAVAPAAEPVKKRGGINENYARELMELHSLGVDGGYTQQDVQEVARCFTGWSLNRSTGEFQFRQFAHDDGEKVVLGQRIPAGGGIQDGERVLDILAKHPSTAKFLARKLCVRLVADTPPQSVVDKAARTFTQSDGDLRAVVKTIVTSPEFFSTGAYRAKIKSPFEYAVSSIRALGGTLLIPDASIPSERLQLVADGASSVRPGRGRYNKQTKSLAMHIADMGQPLYSYQAPTGYSEDSTQWVSTGALVARLNFALALVGSQVSNVIATPSFLLKGVDEHDQEETLRLLQLHLLAGDLSAGTQSTLQREAMGEGNIDRRKLTALLLGSPEFQRR